MAKGSKKYLPGGHEYSFTKGAASGLGKDLEAHKSKANQLREGSRTIPKMSDGGSTHSSPLKKYSDGGQISSSSSRAEVAKSFSGATGSSGISQGISNIKSMLGMGHAEGGKVSKHDKRNLKQLNDSLNKFFKEEASEKAKGGVVEQTQGKAQADKDTKGGSMYELSSSLKKGGKVPGKAKVKGDSKKNDTTLALLSPGEFVVKRSIMNSKDAPKKAAKAIEKEKRKK
jgi:hypothetical protein